MLTRTLHRLVAQPRIYDAVQILAGAAAVRRRLARLAPHLPGGALVLDVGAGTGLYRNVWSPAVRYVCIDLDPLKLHGFRSRHRDSAICADAVHLPVPDGSADAVASTLMAHHLTDPQLAGMLEEISRVLKPEGALLFADPLWRPQRLPGRMLWRYDRGAHPRTASDLRRAIERRLQVRQWHEFAVWHRYAACVAVNRQRSG